MGSRLIGHLVPGFFFLVLGQWHLFNHIKLYILHPNSYTSFLWFPTSKIRHLELFLIMIASSISVLNELFVSPRKHHPFDSDGTIPSTHLHNFEHSSISMAFFAYAALAILFDKPRLRVQHGMTSLVGAIAFAQELFLFHFHSTDHMGVEGQYHLFLQFIVAVSLVTTLMGIGMPRSFMVSFVRSFSVTFQGVWLIAMAYMLWISSLVPKGCFLHLEDANQVVRCSSKKALSRAKSLVNIKFSWFLIGTTGFVMLFYLALNRIYGEKIEYSTLNTKDQLEGTMEAEADDDDVESQKIRNKTFIEMGGMFAHNTMEGRKNLNGK